MNSHFIFLLTSPPDIHIDSRPVDSDSRPMTMTPVRVVAAIVHVQPIARLDTASSADTVTASFTANAVRARRRGEQSRGSQSRCCGSHERNHAHGVTSSFLFRSLTMFCLFRSLTMFCKPLSSSVARDLFRDATKWNRCSGSCCGLRKSRARTIRDHCVRRRRRRRRR
jgi:hypothetical protein